MEAIGVVLSLLGDFVSNGLEEEHIRFARDYLCNQYPFLYDTPLKKMELMSSVDMTGKPADFVERYREYVEAVSPDRALTAVSSVLRPEDQSVVVVGDESLERGMSRLPGVSEFRVISSTYDALL